MCTLAVLPLAGGIRSVEDQIRESTVSVRTTQGTVRELLVRQARIMEMYRGHVVMVSREEARTPCAEDFLPEPQRTLTRIHRLQRDVESAERNIAEELQNLSSIEGQMHEGISEDDLKVVELRNARRALLTLAERIRDLSRSLTRTVEELRPPQARAVEELRPPQPRARTAVPGAVRRRGAGDSSFIHAVGAGSPHCAIL